MSAALEKELLNRQADASSEKWQWLSKISRYQKMVQQMTAEAERAQQAFARERAEMQVSDDWRQAQRRKDALDLLT